MTSKQEALTASVVEKASLSELLNNMDIDINMDAPTGLGRVISLALSKYITQQSLSNQLERHSVDLKNHMGSSIEMNNDWIRKGFKEVNHGLEQWKKLQPYFENMDAMDAAHRKESPTLWAALKNLKDHGTNLENRLSTAEKKAQTQTELLRVMDFNIKEIPAEYTHKKIGEDTVIKLNQNYKMVEELRALSEKQISLLRDIEDANDSRHHNTEYGFKKLKARVATTEEQGRHMKQKLIMHDHVLSHLAGSPLVTTLPVFSY